MCPNGPMESEFFDANRYSDNITIARVRQHWIPCSAFVEVRCDDNGTSTPCISDGGPAADRKVIDIDYIFLIGVFAEKLR